MAIAAASAQNQVTQQGKVVVPTDGMVAARAMRAGQNYGFALGQARDAYVQEAAKYQAEETYHDVDDDHAFGNLSAYEILRT